LRPGEEPNNYSDEEEETPNESNTSNKSEPAISTEKNDEKSKDD